MNIFKGLMFLQGHRIPLEYVDDVVAGTEPAPSYAEGYGNAVASARQFGPHHYGHRGGGVPGDGECVAGGCA